ncbi:MAG: hypothetical protein ACRYGP_05780 [Janthinobacterium lividum]
MRDDLKDRLRASFSGGRSPGAAPSATPGLLSPDEDFVRGFLLKADRVVVPAMLEVGRVVERHGRFFSIERIAARQTCHGALVPTSIQMNVFRRQHTVNFKNGAPHFNVDCDPAGRRVLFRRTTLLAGTGAEEVGTCGLDALTRDLVQDKIAAMLDILARM